MKNLFVFIFSSFFFFTSCSDDNAKNSDNEDISDLELSNLIFNGIVAQNDNELIEFNGIQVDETIDFVPNLSGLAKLIEDDKIQLDLNFVTTNGNVNGIGILIGDSNTLIVFRNEFVLGENYGVINKEVLLNLDFCEQLNNECKEISIKQFLITNNNEISGMIQKTLIIPCGNCEDESCIELNPFCSNGNPWGFKVDLTGIGMGSQAVSAGMESSMRITTEQYLIDQNVGYVLGGGNQINTFGYYIDDLRASYIFYIKKNLQIFRIIIPIIAMENWEGEWDFKSCADGATVELEPPTAFFEVVPSRFYCADDEFNPGETAGTGYIINNSSNSFSHYMSISCSFRRIIFGEPGISDETFTVIGGIEFNPIL